MPQKKISIRKAKLADLTPITHLMKKLVQYDRVFDPTIDSRWSDSKPGIKFLKDRIQHKDGLVLVATEKDKIVGYLIGGLCELSEYRKANIVIAELEEIFVLDAYRGHSIGERLSQQFFDWAKRLKVNRIHVVVSAPNVRTIKFYHHLGFKDYDLVLEKTLKSS